jgi:hypothetical protein
VPVQGYTLPFTFCVCNHLFNSKGSYDVLKNVQDSVIPKYTNYLKYEMYVIEI